MGDPSFDLNSNLLLLDPDANLVEQEQLILFISNSDVRRQFDELMKASERLRWLRDRLNTWLVGGGYEPDWSRAPHARVVYGK